MEEQCEAQLIAQQMLPKGWEGSRKFHISSNSNSILIQSSTESWKRISVDGWTTVSAQPNPSTDEITIPSLLNVGEARKKSYQAGKWEPNV